MQDLDLRIHHTIMPPYESWSNSNLSVNNGSKAGASHIAQPIEVHATKKSHYVNKKYLAFHVDYKDLDWADVYSLWV